MSYGKFQMVMSHGKKYVNILNIIVRYVKSKPFIFFILCYFSSTQKMDTLLYLANAYKDGVLAGKLSCYQLNILLETHFTINIA